MWERGDKSEMQQYYMSKAPAMQLRTSASNSIQGIHACTFQVSKNVRTHYHKFFFFFQINCILFLNFSFIHRLSQRHSITILHVVAACSKREGIDEACAPGRTVGSRDVEVKRPWVYVCKVASR